MSLYKLVTKSKKHSQKSSATEHAQIQKADELLKEVDSLALLLEEVKKQSQRIQAAADAIGENIFGSGYLESAPESAPNAQTIRKISIGPKLVVRSRSVDNSAGSNRNTILP